MINPTRLSPTDARHAFLQSASEVLHAVEVDREHAADLIAGVGDRRDLPLLARKVVYRHWERLDALEVLGSMWLVDQELDGLSSAIREVGVDVTAGLVVDELAGLAGAVDVVALADSDHRERQAQAA